MTLLLRLLSAIALIMGLQTAGTAESCEDLKKLSEIKIKPGINSVANFDSYGRTAKIVMASYFGDTANQSYRLFFIYLEDENKSGLDKKIVETRAGSAAGSTIRDLPFDGEATVRTVLFARGTCNGHPNQIFMFVATRKLDAGHYEPVPVDFEIYKLIDGKETDSYLHEDWFQLVRSFTSKGTFGSSNAALEQEFHLTIGPPAQR